MSGISVGTITSYERDGRVTRGSNGILGADQLAVIRAAFELVGVEFTEENGGVPGIRLQSYNVTAQAAQDALAGSGSVMLAQLKAAREMLGWGVHKLAYRSGTSSHLIRTYERSGQVAKTVNRISPADPLAAIRAALEEAGIEFVEESEAGLGVRLRYPQETP